jgi:hypothetical protein
MKYFKLGQTVYHNIYGEGVVVEINESNYPIGVKFGEKYTTFTFDGRVAKNESISLSQTPIAEIVNVPLEDEYIHFTIEDDLLGMKVISKDKSCKGIITYQDNYKVVIGSYNITYKELLKEYTFIDDKPCGKL